MHETCMTMQDTFPWVHIRTIKGDLILLVTFFTYLLFPLLCYDRKLQPQACYSLLQSFCDIQGNVFHLPRSPPAISKMADSLCNLYLRRETLAWAPKERRLPVTLVTGPLGAGKTSLLNHILNNKYNLKIAAAVNDFASINVDGQIIKRNNAHGSVVELTSGCLCCTVSEQFEAAVVQLLQDADIGKIDYLVIETSGVTDPHATISALERQYGKLFRIRLDAVVTVLDADLLVGKMSGVVSTLMDVSATEAQLLCADVVLLNKMDLVSGKDLEDAKEYLRKLIPGVQVHACQNGAVPLDIIMEVMEVDRTQILTHEFSAAAYSISTDGGTKNKERQERLSKEKHIPSAHLSEDEFCSVTFEAPRPFRLNAFQEFLGEKFPAGVVRMKGTVWFEENRTCLYQFHMSGRQRYEITALTSHDTNTSGAFGIQLVAIGRGMDTDMVKALLEDCVDDGRQRDIAPGIESVCILAKTLVEADKQFELVEFVCSVSKAYIDFRLTGCISYGLTPQEACGVYGIDFNKMNAELVGRVNASSGPASLLPVLLPTGTQVCRHALNSGTHLFQRAWKLVTELAPRLVAEYYRAVGYCKCGM